MMAEASISYEKHGKEIRCVVDGDSLEDIVGGIAELIWETTDVTGMPETAVLALATVQVMKNRKEPENG